MKEFVRGDAGQSVEGLAHGAGAHVDGGGEGVLHAAARGAAREVIDEHVGVEGTVVHPTGGGGDNLAQRGHNFGHGVVGGVGIDHDAVMGAAFVKVGFLE